MAQPAPRQHTASANALPADVQTASASRRVGTSTAPRTRGQASQPRLVEIGGPAKTRHGRKSSLKNAKNSTDALRARLKEDAARRGSPPEGRAGRAWAVGNIGHNGRLYLRPVIRPGSERSKPPGAPFTNAQPRRSSRVGEHLRAARAISTLEFDGSQPETYAAAALPRIHVHSSALSDYSIASSQVRRGSLQRSHSFSTIDGAIYARAEAPGAVRVVISRARSHRDKRGHRQDASRDTGRLGVPIPTSTLGEPQFGPSGTPTFRTSSQTTDRHQHSESMKSGHTSLMQQPQAIYAPPVSRRHSEMSHTPALVFRPSANNSVATSSPQLAVYIRERDFWTHAYAFDHLETHPVDPSLIIYADFKGPKKRRIIFATPLTLVAQITSSTNVDYDLLSDFFMTFRQFMPKVELLEFLHDRFLWAVARQGNVSTAVRVRTFVALRHWVLNYMAEDFVPDYQLRAAFCALMNSLYDYLKDIGAMGPKGLEQIAELKRCWRQYISLYFDIAYDEYASSSEPIQPGGGLDSEGDDLEATGSKLQAQLETQALSTSKSTRSLRHARSNIHPIGAVQSSQQPPKASPTAAGTENAGSTAAKSARPQLDANNTSQKSSTVWSCSIPFRGQPILEFSDQSATYKQAAPRTVALPPQLVNPLRANRPKQVQQSEEAPVEPSLDSQALEEKLTIAAEGDDLGRTLEEGTSSSASLPGDLIRGRSLLPYAPDVEYQKDRPPFEVAETPDKTSKSDGVRRVIGSIRRAVSQSRTLQGPPLRHAHLERHGNQFSTVATTTRASAPSAATSSTTQSMRAPKTERVLGPLRPRTDLLSERSLESFNKALALAPTSVTAGPIQVHEPSQEVKEPRDRLTVPIVGVKRERSAGVLTTGSRSIVIGHEGTDAASSVVDSDILMSGALPTPRVVHKEVSDTESDMAGFQAPIDDDEPIEAATDDGWQSEEPEWDMYPASSPPLVSPVQSFDDKSPVTSISGAYLAQEMEARLGHQPTNSLDDPVLPDDPQPERSLRRRNDRRNLRAALPSFHERLAAAQGPLPDALHSHPPSRPSSLLTPDDDLPPLPSPGVLGPTVEEQLKSMLFPDDPNEDGSPATALLKLEGRFESPVKERTSFDLDLPQESPSEPRPRDKLRHRHEHVMDAHEPIHEPRSSVVFSQASTAVSPVNAVHRHNQSEVSYNSIPLLQRGADGPTPRRRSRLRIRDSDSTESAADYQFPARTGELRAINPDSMSEDVEHETVSRSGSAQGLSLEDIVSRSLAAPGATQYDTDHENDEDAYDGPVGADGPRSFYDDQMSAKDDAARRAMLHGGRHPSTPPAGEGEDPDAYSIRISNGLPTPANSPPSRLPPKMNFSAGVYMPTRILTEEEEPQPRPQPRMAPPKHSAFILRFRAERLAEAFTLVEQSALAQVNWRELIDLSWSKTGLEKVRDWAEFVVSPRSSAISHRRSSRSSHTPKSVDVVIARFNVVVKWAVSQILLTDDLFERVHCIQQYIRVAAACRTLRNFASMYQITTALISADLAGLQDTWNLVPESDKAWLKEMENLVSPLKSFENVRKEQEAVTPGAAGCIPFIGVYLNDLALNATRVPTVEKPATLAHLDLDTRTFLGPPHGSQTQKHGLDQPQRMVNFERYQNAAAIVKTVLRLVEASKQYQFDVNPKLLSKCLWMSALGDEEIRARARAMIS